MPATTNPTIRLDSTDPQDLADLIQGLTVVGAYCANSGQEENASRVSSLRRRLVIENRALARDLTDPDAFNAAATDAQEFAAGVADILDDTEAER